MKNKIRVFLWKILGIDYDHTLRIHDYVFLKKDKFSTIGDKTYDNGALVWRWTNAPLVIGKFCSIANNVRFIVDEGHHTASTITNFPLVNNLFKEELLNNKSSIANEIINKIKQKEGITIGNDVWIGMGTFIMPGVTIGNGATIGANSLVTRDIPDYAVAFGSPAKVIKLKHSKEVILALNKIAWWNWDEKKIKSRIAEFYSNIEIFIDNHKN
ncbi:CatB-related O-acetyltransferase [Algibacter sp. L4_22]|uniref:CatB-related O-acetyltransferase n=1 Tax=Algibacter sp. L4_22 TaxID=2942477 RepID=UPI00201B6DD8|nr:CatB-related O-acetyltransferase [Algibacter sp. L4_22]MCL5127853.1 CatB-related O-acetyltransferase [Algibacter sp. L4_22]